jgi:hypothetical protein
MGARRLAAVPIAFFDSRLGQILDRTDSFSFIGYVAAWAFLGHGTPPESVNLLDY